MNRLTAIGLASLVAYGLLIASKYAGVVSAAPDEASGTAARTAAMHASASGVEPLSEEHAAPLPSFPAPVPRPQTHKLSAVALEFRTARDLKAFADALAARGESLTADERFHLAKALEECQFVASISEDLAAYGAKQRRQFLSSLPAGDPLNEKRIAAYEAVDNTQRCLGFQNSKVSPKDIDALYRAAALQGDPRAQARLITAELTKSMNSKGSETAQPTATTARAAGEDFSDLVRLLDTRDPEALLYVGQFLAQNAVAQNLRVGPNGEVPEPSAFLGAFSLVACDLGQECTSLHRDLEQACAYGAYCNAQSFEELYQNFLASPWAYSQAMRYRMLIRTAIDQRNYGLIGLTPKIATRGTQ